MSLLDEAEVQRMKDVIGDKGELVFAQRSGSWSFNLSLPTSDVDFFGVFVAPDPLDISVKSFDHTVQGNSGDDWVLYEIGKYVELVAKGNPKVVEPLFANHFVYVTPLWEKLREVFRPMVVNKLTVAQYTSFASFELHEAEKKKKAAKATEVTLASHGKPLYHGLRLAREAKRMQQGLPPRVWWEGDDREELMAIRTGKSGKTFDEVAAQVKAEIDSVKDGRIDASIPDHLDMERLGNWIVEVRLPVLRTRAARDGFDLSSLGTPSAPSTSTTESTSEVSSPPSHPSTPGELSASENSAEGKFAHIISRTHRMLQKAGYCDTTVLFIAPIGTELVWALSGKDSLERELSPNTSTIPDYLVVYRLPVVDILNPMKEVPPYLIEYPKEKYGSGIWAIELDTALKQITRHHVAFESLVALPNDARCKLGSTIWAHALWEPYAKILADVWQRGAAVTFGLLGHYLGVATGLLKSGSIWSIESAPLVAADESAKDASAAPSGDSAGTKQAPEMELAKAYQLALRLFMQASQLLPSDATKASLLSKTHCEELISIPRCGPSSSASADWMSKRDALLVQVTDLQTQLKKVKLATELPKDVKSSLTQELRKSRYQTIPQ